MANIKGNSETGAGSGNFPVVKEKHKVPSVQDIMDDTNLELAYKNNTLQKVLQMEPKKEWLREHHSAKRKVYDGQGNKIEVPALYMPIGIQEYLMTSIFGFWRREIKSVTMHANSEVTIMRVWYWNPLLGEWDYTDGVGAAPVQTAKGKGATDFEHINTYSVQQSAPSSASYAFKDAVENLGKIFGKDVNRLDNMNYEPMLEKQFDKIDKKLYLPEDLKTVIKLAQKEELSSIFRANKDYEDNKEFMELLNARREELNLVETPGKVDLVERKEVNLQNFEDERGEE